MSHPFEYQKPTHDQTMLMKIVGVDFRDTYDAMLMCAPASPERTIAIRKLQEARMWTNVAILEFGQRRRKWQPHAPDVGSRNSHQGVLHGNSRDVFGFFDRFLDASDRFVELSD